jgi:hypothetical protein
MGVDPKSGKKTITIRDSAKKVLFSGNDKIESGKDSSGRIAPKGSTETNRFKSDSIAYVKDANYQADKKNIGQAATNSAYQNAKAFVGKKKK